MIHDRDGVRDLELRQYGVEKIRIPNSLLIRDSLLVEQIVVAAVAQRRAVMRT
ncbi:MAG: hypothetical protein ACXVH7_13290 [Thermoanaerobaculia bacterium]